MKIENIEIYGIKESIIFPTQITQTAWMASILWMDWIFTISKRTYYNIKIKGDLLCIFQN